MPLVVLLQPQQRPVDGRAAPPGGIHHSAVDGVRGREEPAGVLTRVMLIRFAPLGSGCAAARLPPQHRRVPALVPR